MEVNEKVTHLESIRATSKLDSNIDLISLRFNRNHLFYNPFTAGYAEISESEESTINVSVKMEPVALSFVTPSAFVYDDFDLESEKLTGLIFMKSVEDLQTFEFIRSPIFRFYIDGYEYNHFISGPFEFSINFNKIANFPNPNLSEIEIEKLKGEAELSLNITDPANYYCLGNFNEITRTWNCVSRNILSISENKIEFTAITTGIFAVLYCPKAPPSEDQLTGFMFRHKRLITSLVLVLIPIIVILISFLVSIFKNWYIKVEDKIKSATKNDDESFFKDNKVDEFETDEDNILVENANHAYNNPLLFNEDMEQNDINVLENTKMKLKYKNEKLLTEKLKQLRKNMAIKFEIESLREQLRKLQSIEDRVELDGQIYENE